MAVTAEAPAPADPGAAPELLDELVVQEQPLATRVALAMAEAGVVTKSEQADAGSGGRYKYASAEAILAAVRGPLLRRGIMLIPTLEDLEEQAITSGSGKQGTRVLVRLRFTFTDGRESIEREWRGEGQDYGDKAYGKAFTNCVKTFIRTAWLLPTEHDDPEGSPSGDRVNAPTAQPAPAWAAFLTEDADKAEAIGHMHRIIYAADPDTSTRKVAAATLGQWAKVAGGGIPVVIANTLKALGLMFPEPPVEDPAAAADADRQATAGEEPQAPADDTAASSPDESTTRPAPPDGFDHWPTAAEFIDRRFPEATGTLAERMDALVKAGCVCSDPLAAPADTDKHDDRCPFADHGIPF